VTGKGIAQVQVQGVMDRMADAATRTTRETNPFKRAKRNAGTTFRQKKQQQQCHQPKQ